MTRMIELHGHRGARGLFPENTLPGFAATLALGVDALELDVAVTADDVAVVTHDPRLNPDITRGPDGAWLAAPGPAILSLRAADLARYDVGRIRPGSVYAAQYPDQVPHDGARIPLLADVLRLAPAAASNRGASAHVGSEAGANEGGASGAVMFNVELKSFPGQPDLAIPGEAMAEAVMAVADAAGVTRRLIVQSFDWRGPRHLRRTRPEVLVSWLTHSALLASARRWWGGPHPADYGGSLPRAVAAEGGTIWAPDHASVTADAVAEAHSLGVRVIPWTVNGIAEMRRLLACGVDGLITDRPDRARGVLAEPERDPRR
ncbi:MAG: glycerophosphodiester phosphodiesterase [Acetobacteraceae bacterium]